MSKLRFARSISLHPQVRFADDPLARGTHIFVKGVTSRQLQLFTSLSTSAEVVSQALAQRVNGPAPMLKWGGHYLNGARPLSSYRVRSGDTIQTSLGLRGGMHSPSAEASADAAGASLPSSMDVDTVGWETGIAQLNLRGGVEKLKSSWVPVVTAWPQQKLDIAMGLNEAWTKLKQSPSGAEAEVPGAGWKVKKSNENRPLYIPPSGKQIDSMPKVLEKLELIARLEQRAGAHTPVPAPVPAPTPAPAPAPAPVPLQPQPSFATGVVILGDESLFQSEAIAETPRAPLSEAVLGDFTKPQESRLDCVFASLATVLKSGGGCVDLEQLESEIASELRENRLLSRDEAGWKALAKAHLEQIDENDADKRRLRGKQGELDRDEELKVTKELEELDATGKRLEKERKAYPGHQNAYKEAALDVPKHKNAVVELNHCTLPMTLPALSGWDASTAYVVHLDGRTAALAFLCEFSSTAAPDDDEDTVLEDDPPPPVRVKAVWEIKGESFSVELDGIFGLPPMNDDAEATSKAIEELFASLQKAFEDVDQAEPRAFMEGCTIRSCRIERAKSTDGIRIRIEPPITLTHEPTYLKMIKDFKSAFGDGKLEGKPGDSKLEGKSLAELKILIDDGDAIPTQPDVDKGQTIPRADAPVIFPKQREVGDRIFARAQEVLGTDAWSSFNVVEFLVVTANFTTIREQTMERLSEHGLLPDSEDGQKKVVFTYLKSKDSLTACVWKLNHLLSQLSLTWWHLFAGTRNSAKRPCPISQRCSLSSQTNATGGLRMAVVLGSTLSLPRSF